jgi:hypothetical protein
MWNQQKKEISHRQVPDDVVLDFRPDDVVLYFRPDDVVLGFRPDDVVLDFIPDDEDIIPHHQV